LVEEVTHIATARDGAIDRIALGVGEDGVLIAWRSRFVHRTPLWSNVQSL
jgi:hypothetical protein